MMYVKFPCKNCPDRYPACHDNCDRYKEAKAKNLEIEKNKSEFDNAYRDNICRAIKYQKDHYRGHRRWKIISNR